MSQNYTPKPPITPTLSHIYLSINTLNLSSSFIKKVFAKIKYKSRKINQVLHT